MRKSKLHYIKLSARIHEKKLLEMFRVVYDKYSAKETLYIKENISNGEKYSCWLYEKSYLKIDDYTYLWKLPSACSPNDTAGNFNYLDKNSKPIVLDINIDLDSYPPFGFRFSDLKDIESKVIDFFNDIKQYKDIHEGNFFYKNTKQELVDIVESNNIDLSRFDEDILNKIDKTYYSNNKFDKNASIDVTDKFKKIFAIVR